MLLEKFLTFYPYIINGDFPAEVKQINPSPEDVEAVKRLRESMGKLQISTKALQTKGLQFSRLARNEDGK